MTIDYLIQIQFAADTAMAMLIWLIQLVIYPAFRVVDRDAFHDWHLNYMKTISCIVIPLMLLQALCHGILMVLNPSAMQWIASGAILGAWIATFTLSVPCHQRLQQAGFERDTVNRLIKTNGVRTVFWSLPFLSGIV